MTERGSRRRRIEEYANLQAIAFAVALAKVQSSLPASARLRLIGSKAMEAFEQQWRPNYRQPAIYGQWDWPGTILPRFARQVDALRLAIWSDNSLCGLAIGGPNNRHTTLIVNFIAGAPVRTHPLRGSVLALSIAAADEYARGLGAKSLALADPAPGLSDRYAELGFRLVEQRGAVPYCVRRV